MNFWESEVIKTVYQNEDNYYVMECNPESDICFVFFSGNGLYYPNTEAQFEKTVISANRYEWQNISQNKKLKQYAGKIILVRDIYKCWYMKGISAKYNSIDKVVELIQELSKGYKVITVGNSAGGYMATLVAALVEAMSCFNFCGQYNIQESVESEISRGKNVYPRDKDRYYSLISFVRENDTNIYYFFPNECDIDILQYKLIKDIKNIKTFAFKGKEHGKTMFSSCIPYVLRMSNERLDLLLRDIGNAVFSKWNFTFYVAPWYSAFGICCKESIKYLYRKARKAIK